MSEWISVNDRLPDEGERVIIWFKETVRSWRCRFGEIMCGHWRPEGGNGNFDDMISFWMPLPEPPTTKPTEGRDPLKSISGDKS